MWKKIKWKEERKIKEGLGWTKYYENLEMILKNIIYQES